MTASKRSPKFAKLRGSLSLEGFPRFFGIRIRLYFFRVRGGSSPFPYPGRVPDKVYGETLWTTVMETENDLMRPSLHLKELPISFATSLREGFYYPDVEISYSIDEGNGHILSGGRHFRPSKEPFRVKEGQISEISLRVLWPE